MATTPTATDWTRLGERIAQQRKWFGWDQKQLAQRAAVSENTIGNYERGRVPASGKLSAGYLRVEQVFRWDKGSMQSILEGGNASRTVPLGTAYDNTIPGAAGVESSERRPWLREGGATLRATADLQASGYVVKSTLPQEVRDALSSATNFARLSRQHGASPEAVQRYEQALEALIGNLVLAGEAPEERVLPVPMKRRIEEPTAGQSREEAPADEE